MQATTRVADTGSVLAVSQWKIGNLSFGSKYLTYEGKKSFQCLFLCHTRALEVKQCVKMGRT